MKWLVAFLLAAVSACGFTQHATPSATDEVKELKALTVQHDSLLAAFHKHPKDAALKKKYVFITVKLGMKTMYAASLPPRQKYPGALKRFNEALAVDPTNKDAREQKEMIESVYRGMGRKPGG